MIGVLMFAGCAPAASPLETLPPQATETAPPPEDTATPAKPAPTPALATLPPSAQPVPEETAAQELPPQSLLSQILADAAVRAGVSADTITVVQSEAIVWNDGSLGCPQPGFAYTQALVPGYHVILDAAGQKYDYHTSETRFILCEN